MKKLCWKSQHKIARKLAKIVNGINEHLKPFEIQSGNSKIPLLNIVSGNVVDESTKVQVFDAKSIG